MYSPNFWLNCGAMVMRYSISDWMARIRWSCCIIQCCLVSYSIFRSLTSCMLCISNLSYFLSKFIAIYMFFPLSPFSLFNSFTFYWLRLLIATWENLPSSSSSWIYYLLILLCDLLWSLLLMLLLIVDSFRYAILISLEPEAISLSLIGISFRIFINS